MWKETDKQIEERRREIDELEKKIKKMTEIENQAIKLNHEGRYKEAIEILKTI